MFLSDVVCWVILLHGKESGLVSAAASKGCMSCL
jgi:hypothetical protein